MKFEIGEKVKIKTFKNKKYPNWWVHEMIGYAGKDVIIKSRRKSHLPYGIHGNNWGWKESDFEKMSYLPEELFEI